MTDNSEIIINNTFNTMTCVKSTENTASQQHQVMSMQNRTVNLYFLNVTILSYTFL